eukprot:UN05038
MLFKDVTSFFVSPHVSSKLVAFFHVIRFLRTGCFKYCLFLPFTVSILCFVVKNDVGQKIYLCFFSKMQHQCCLRSYFFSFIICFIKTGCFKCLVFG